MFEKATAIAVKPATVDDRLIVESLLEDARAWLASRGIRQWTRPFADDWIDETIAAGEWQIAFRDGAPVAITRLLWSDALFWGERERGDAAYIHTLVVRRDVSGQGVGADVLAWAASQARDTGRRFLRLDCGKENQALVAYYLKQGFLPAGEIEIASEIMQLLQKEIGFGSARHDAPGVASQEPMANSQ